jgi:hypothetical protein
VSNEMYKFHVGRVRNFYEHVYSNIRHESPHLPDEAVRGMSSNLTIGYVHGIYSTGMMDSRTCRALIEFAAKVMPKEYINWLAIIKIERRDATDQHPNEPND